MMTDLERALRDMMNRTADGLDHVPQPSRGLVRRARLARARNATFAGAVCVALVIGGFAGARSLSSDDAAPLPPADRSSPTNTDVTVVQGTAEVRSRAVLELCEFLFGECTPTPMMPGDNHLLSVEVSATRVGTDISGSGFIQGGGLDDSFTVHCSRQIEVSTIAVGGTFDEGEFAGRAVAFVINDLDPAPDRLAIWFERDSPGEGGCESTLDGLETRGWDNLIYEPVTSGDFTIGGEESPSEPDPNETPKATEASGESIALLGGEVKFQASAGWREHVEWNLTSRTGGPESLLLLDNASGSASIAHLLVIVDPVPAKALESRQTDCPEARASVISAEAFADAVQANTGLVSTDPIAEQIAGVDALRLDVNPVEGAPACGDMGAVFKGGPEADRGVPVVAGTRDTYFGPSDTFVVPDGMRMRLYLFDVPRGEARTLGIAILAAEEDFNTAVTEAKPILDSLEFAHELP